MRKLQAIIFLLLLSVTAATAQDNTSADVNGDGIVTTADAQLIYGYILGTSEDVTLVQADVDGNGTVNTADVVEVYASAFSSRLKAVVVNPVETEIDYKEPVVAFNASVTPAKLSAYICEAWNSGNDKAVAVSNGMKVTAVSINADGTLAIRATGDPFDGDWHKGSTTVTVSLAWDNVTVTSSPVTLVPVNVPMEGYGNDTEDYYDFGEIL